MLFLVSRIGHFGACSLKRLGLADIAAKIYIDEQVNAEALLRMVAPGGGGDFVVPPFIGQNIADDPPPPKKKKVFASKRVGFQSESM